MTIYQGKLSAEGIDRVLESLLEHKQIEWCDKLKKQCFIYWKNPQEWGNLIYRYASDKGLTNTVCTFYELTASDDVQNEGIFSSELILTNIKMYNTYYRDNFQNFLVWISLCL